MECPSCHNQTDDDIPFCIVCGNEFPSEARTLKGITIHQHYLLGDLLGQGGMGEVYEGIDTRDNKRVAVKLVLAAIADDETTKKRFNIEAQALTSVCHPNLVSVLDAGTDEITERPFLIMDFVEGCGLDELIADKPLTTSNALRIIVDIASAVSTLHACGWLHRDIKPSNVIVQETGEAVLLDAGIARSLTSNLNITMMGNVVGTPQAMAPEQILGKALDARTDVYQLGMLLLAMLLGQSAFSAGSTQSWFHMHLSGGLKVTAGQDQRGKLSAVAGKAIATKPDERYQTVDAMLEALHEVIN